MCLNPFRAGRCLSTAGATTAVVGSVSVSIPFEQGDVFRPQGNCEECRS